MINDKVGAVLNSQNMMPEIAYIETDAIDN